MGVESYKHQFAKATLAGWLREVAAGVSDNYTSLGAITWRVNRGEPHYGVWTEYPFCLDRNNNIVGGSPVWDETDDAYHDAPPSYEQCIAKELLPICIFDVVIQHKGSIAHVFEVIHKNGINTQKAEYMLRINEECGPFHFHVLSADWILSQVGRPKRLKFLGSTQK